MSLRHCLGVSSFLCYIVCKVFYWEKATFNYHKALNFWKVSAPNRPPTNFTPESTTYPQKWFGVGEILRWSAVFFDKSKPLSVCSKAFQIEHGFKGWPDGEESLIDVFKSALRSEGSDCRKKCIIEPSDEGVALF